MNFNDFSSLYNFADGVPKIPKVEQFCRARRLGKAHKLPFDEKFEKRSHGRENIHFDVMGKLEFLYSNPCQYVCTYLDDFSKYTFNMILRHRDEVSEARELVLHRSGQSQFKAANFQLEEEIILVHLMAQTSTNRCQKELELKTWSKLSLVLTDLSAVTLQKA